MFSTHSIPIILKNVFTKTFFCTPKCVPHSASSQCKKSSQWGKKFRCVPHNVVRMNTQEFTQEKSPFHVTFVRKALLEKNIFYDMQELTGEKPFSHAILMYLQSNLLTRWWNTKRNTQCVITALATLNNGFIPLETKNFKCRERSSRLEWLLVESSFN